MFSPTPILDLPFISGILTPACLTLCLPFSPHHWLHLDPFTFTPIPDRNSVNVFKEENHEKPYAPLLSNIITLESIDPPFLTVY